MNVLYEVGKIRIPARDAGVRLVKLSWAYVIISNSLLRILAFFPFQLDGSKKLHGG